MSTGGVEGPSPHQFTALIKPELQLGKLIPGPSTISTSKKPMGSVIHIDPAHATV